MNKIHATIRDIQTVENITVVELETNTSSLRLMALDLSRNYQIGTQVILGAKTTNTALGKNLQGHISISNQLACSVKSINKGKLLCSVKLDFEGTTLESIITNKSLEGIQIEVGEDVDALIKASELSILKVLS